MFRFGVDVLTMASVAILAVVVTQGVARMVPLDEETGRACVITASFTGAVMVFAYIVMARLLDAMVTML